MEHCETLNGFGCRGLTYVFSFGQVHQPVAARRMPVNSPYAHAIYILALKGVSRCILATKPSIFCG